MNYTDMEEAILGVLDSDEIAADLSRIVRIPSITGDERNAVGRFAEMAEAHGLESTLQEHDLEALRRSPGYPGEEAPRDELVGLVSVLKGGSSDAPRICLNGHLDVVNPGTFPWEGDPFSGAVEGGFVHGRGSVDMKGGLIAALHAVSAIESVVGEVPGDIVLQAVSSEEDGGLGTFASLERDSDFAACIIPEPTSFKVCCAHAGALTFRGTVPGVSAHAALRLEGVSAIDRYIPIHGALQEHERRINSDVENPLMAALELPYPVVVGQLRAGAWSSQVPDRLYFEGRVGVRVGESVEVAKGAFEEVVREACPEATISWSGGEFAPAETPADHPLVQVAGTALAHELGHSPELCGLSAGTDMRLFTARKIPCVMVGTNGIELAHAVNERVSIEDVYRLARVLAHSLAQMQFGEGLRVDRAGSQATDQFRQQEPGG